MATHEEIARDLIREHGPTFAEAAGITLADRPMPLYQLLVLSSLLSARISGDIAVAATRELFAAGYRTPAAMVEASWQNRVDALGRGHYRRYDESTATQLGEAADQCQERWQGDLRRMHAEAGDDPDELRRHLTAFTGIGPTGADIFLREVQGVWTGLAPFVDAKVADAAELAGLPRDPVHLAGLVPHQQLPVLAAALIRFR